MNKHLAHTGIWIDRSKAVVVMIDSGKSFIIPIFSSIRLNRVNNGHSPGKGVNSTAADSQFFDRILDYLPTDHKIIILGPDETKFDFREYLQKKRPELSSVQTKVAGHMATYDVVETVRNHFYSNNLA